MVPKTGYTTMASTKPTRTPRARHYLAPAMGATNADFLGLDYPTLLASADSDLTGGDRRFEERTHVTSVSPRKALSAARTRDRSRLSGDGSPMVTEWLRKAPGGATSGCNTSHTVLKDAKGTR